MIQYKAPLRDIRFLVHDVFDFPGHYRGIDEATEATPDVIDAVLGEAAKFSEEVLSPLYQPSDQGCRFDNGEVTTPEGFKEAYQQYTEAGWQSLSAPAEFGGQGLPESMGIMRTELIGTANWPWSMYPGLSLGAMNTINLHGDDNQKQLYLPPLTDGRWTGTMCLTESQCGTDLGQIKTRAEPGDDGSYQLTGTKIFISSGEHDLSENIVHIVLARLPDAPAGTKGISLFVVPKFIPGNDGNPGERNAVHCGSIEHKMGIHGSSTCVLNFDGARATLLGPPNKGLQCMFTFMNTARIGTSIQGIAAAELSYQGALPYARERASMRSLSGAKAPDKPADPLIVHPDVRRMLLTQKAIAEGGRAMLYYTALLGDHMMQAHREGDQDAFRQWDDKLGFMTPILKAFLTELGYEAANNGVQVFGGHGFIKEWGMEQIVRDTQIAKLYEGTTGVQALDLLGRKVLLGKLKTFRQFRAEVKAFTNNHENRKALKPLVRTLKQFMRQWHISTLRIAFSARRNPDLVGSASVDYLMYSGYVVMAFFWAKMADAAYTQIAKGNDVEFHQAKVQTAQFYFDRMLPRARAHAEMMLKTPESL
ncbi:MAG: acyl-CoA dehydrogenase C-terminal domain-containing protein, partial [Pseudomonadota bacterium]